MSDLTSDPSITKPIKQFFVCNGCKKPIFAGKGVIISGNISPVTENMDDRDSFVGDNLNETMRLISESAYHDGCLEEAVEEGLCERKHKRSSKKTSSFFDDEDDDEDIDIDDDEEDDEYAYLNKKKKALKKKPFRKKSTRYPKPDDEGML